MKNLKHFKSVARTLGSCRVRRSKNRHASQFASLCQQHASGGGGSSGTYSSLTKQFKKQTSATTTLATRRSHSDDADILGSTSRYGGGGMSCKRPKLVFLESATTTSTTNLPSNCTNLCGSLRKSATSTTSATQTLATATCSYAATMSSAASMRLDGKSTTTSSSAATSNTTSTAISMASSSSTGSTNIDQAIQTALQKITRFSQLPLLNAQNSTSGNVDACISCQSTDFSYEIQTCRHLVCRNCLVKLTRAEKCICNAAFRPADVERYHKL